MPDPDPLAIFKDGIAAGIRGDDPRACPHDPMTKEWAEWQRGQTIGAALYPEPPIDAPIVRVWRAPDGTMRQEAVDGSWFYRTERCRLLPEPRTAATTPGVTGESPAVTGESSDR